jgi:hypothetical protein
MDSGGEVVYLRGRSYQKLTKPGVGIAQEVEQVDL